MNTNFRNIISIQHRAKATLLGSEVFLGFWFLCCTVCFLVCFWLFFMVKLGFFGCFWRFLLCFGMLVVCVKVYMVV